MKLRLRSLESKQTLKIEVPNPCNLQQLKEFIILQLLPSSSSSSSSSSPLSQQNIMLSLNGRDELLGNSSEESIQSTGVTSGDLIYYSQNPYAFSSQNPNFLHAQNVENLGVESGDHQVVNLMSEKGEIDVSSDAQINEVSNFDTQMEELSKSSNPSDVGEVLVHDQMEESEKLDECDNLNVVSRKIDDEKSNEMEVDDDENRSTVKIRCTVPGFLKNVYAKEVGDAAENGGNHRLLVIAVHAVLLESGFLGYDTVSGRKVDGFHLPDEWPSSAFGISLHYTLPEISSREVVETVVLKFQTLGKYVNVYGSLARKGSGGVHRICLDEPKFNPALNYVWKNSDRTDSPKLYPNVEIFEFWKVVKDGLSYPLVIDLCEHVGLVPPPCFTLLPTELKLKILEALPATDVARVACLSSELHFVASNNDLWKLKYEEEFGSAASSQSETLWKAKFSSSWETRKKRKSVCDPLRWREPPYFRPLFPGRRDPNANPFGIPFIIGGEYDRLPGYGILQQPGRRRVLRVPCDLGGFGV